MRATLSVPLVGAALVTAGAVIYGIVRDCSRHPLLPGIRSAPPPGGSPGTTAKPESLLERLRERGF